MLYNAFVMENQCWKRGDILVRNTVTLMADRWNYCWWWMQQIGRWVAAVQPSSQSMQQWHQTRAPQPPRATHQHHHHLLSIICRRRLRVDIRQPAVLTTLDTHRLSSSQVLFLSLSYFIRISRTDYTVIFHWCRWICSLYGDGTRLRVCARKTCWRGMKEDTWKALALSRCIYMSCSVWSAASSNYCGNYTSESSILGTTVVVLRIKHSQY